ncbi:hypothetical protein FISHEDRAFT_49047 [Fistulina hepatica ATCC 64428]|uniref:Uncharacterized protein n=1 Tax=Fistulina hepatica ATCC 64428 TaxID=1128425 RepID=A0A0D7A4I1_9AGAR|nr:hypothetical protein FISHEDRAFT_49047 [Fistulina hepatica ATCC 64428]
MFKPVFVFAVTLLSRAAALQAALHLGTRDTPQIVEPASGTVIAPGEIFDFQYNSIADYGTSSYNYTVWLYTTPPTGSVITPAIEYAVGFYFGRFGDVNYPGKLCTGNPDPPNPAPATLTMPDFSKSPRGFGSGATASNLTVYLVVVDEYADGEGSVGYKMSTAVNELVYNGTVYSA